MVDISRKKVTKRIARAACCVYFSKAIFAKILKQGSPKGNVFETARVAGIMAAKKTPEIVPLCHQIGIKKVIVEFTVDEECRCIYVQSEVVAVAQTGVEMEALTVAATSALTIYDMVKCFGQEIIISDLKLLFKSGGKSGVFKR